MADEMKSIPPSAAVPKGATAVVPRATFADEIETWFRDHFTGTILGGTTELYNLAHAAKEDLKSRLAKL